MDYNDLTNYTLEELKKERYIIENEFSKTYDKKTSNKLILLNNAISKKFISDIDLSYYDFNSICKLVNELIQNIINYMDHQLNKKSIFDVKFKIINEDNQTNGLVHLIKKGFLINEYNIKINFNYTSNLHQLIRTITHELRHVYQFEYKLFNVFEELEDYEYIKRPFEVDAFNYVDINFNSIIKNISTKIYLLFNSFEIVI